MANKLADMEIPSDLNAMPPLAAFCSVWGLVSTVLSLVKVFTGSRADAKIDQVLDWGNGVCAAQGMFAENENGKDAEPTA